MSGNDLEGLRNRLRLIGLFMSVVVPVVMVILLWTALQNSGQSTDVVAEGDGIFLWILTGLAIAEPIVGFRVRKRMLTVDAILMRSGNDARNVNQAILAAHMVGFAFALSPTLFGLVIQLVAHNSLLATLLICLSPLAYLVYRPTEASVDDLAREVNAKLTR